MFLWKKYNKVLVGLLISLPLVSCNPVGVMGQEGFQELLRAEKIRADVAAKAQSAVVHIKVEKIVRNNSGQGEINNPFELFNEEFLRRFFPELQLPEGRPPSQQRRRLEGFGSGAIIDAKGHILTNYHVVGEADKILVHLMDGREFRLNLWVPIHLQMWLSSASRVATYPLCLWEIRMKFV